MTGPWPMLSLFTGIGGLDLGLERAGMTVVGQVEKDPYCLRVLAHHWPEVPRHDDIVSAVEWWCGRPRPAVRVVAGGPPCQPISVAGKGRAQEDERWLWPTYFDVVRALRPEYAIMENPSALLARGFGDILGELASLGYDTEWDCVPATAVGAPHRRDRVFIVATDAQREQLRDEPRRRGGQGRTGPAVATDDGTSRTLADATRNGRGTGRSGRSVSAGSNRPAIAATRLARGWAVPKRTEQWATEPDVGRVVYGVPPAVDRLRALGNAVVPQVAEHIGRLVMAAAS